MLQIQQNPPRTCYTIESFCRAHDCSRPTFHKLVNSGQLKTFTIGKRRYVSVEAAQAFVRAREAAEVAEDRQTEAAEEVASA